MRANQLRKLTAILLCLFLLFGLTACSADESGEEKEATITLTDSAGREVEVPGDCDHIAAVDSFCAEALIMVGAGKQICACPHGVQSDKILQEIEPSISELDSVSNDGAINIETLASTDTDLALIKESIYQKEGETAKLDKMGIPYLVVGYETVDEQLEALKMLGKVCSGTAKEKMAEMVDYYEKTISTVKECAAEIPEDGKVTVYHGVNQIALTDGVHSLGKDWIEMVGAIDVSADCEENYEDDYLATLEQIYAWDPDVVICNAADTTDYMYSDSKWTGLRAVRKEQVKTIPVGASRWGHRGSVETFFAMLWLGCEIYPDYYSDIDLKKEVQNFYKSLLGIEVSDETYDTILSGRGMRTPGKQAGEGSK